MKANKKQKQLIHLNAPTRDIKEELVQWATNDDSKTSCNDLSFEQANQVLKRLGKQAHKPSKEDTPLFWGYFDKTNQQHRYVLSILRQMGWTVPNSKYGRLPDIERLGRWLQTKSPVKKPLKQLDPNTEMKRVITALESMTSKQYG